MGVIERHKGMALVVVACAVLGVAAGLGLSVLGGSVAANWEGPERETYISQCYGTDRECGVFCVYPRCTWCVDCSCVCCAATRTNEGCYCSAPCECWDECTGEGEDQVCVEECEDPTLWVFSDCGPVCETWEYLLYVGSNQPGRPDGVVDNPFHVDGLGTALHVVGQPYEGAQCEEEGLTEEERMSARGQGVVWATVEVDTVNGPENLVQPLGVGENLDDLDLELPSGVVLVEDTIPAGENSAVLSGVVERSGVPGQFGVVVSGVPAGAVPLVRHWTAGLGAAPLGGVVPFRPWHSGMVLHLPRGWHAVQAGYALAGGDPIGWSRVEAVFSRAAAGGLGRAVLGQPVPYELEPVPDGVVRPGGLSLGEGVVVAGSGVIRFAVTGQTVGTEVQYRLWPHTGVLPAERDAPWKRAYIADGYMQVGLSGPDGDQAGYMAVQVRLRRNVPGHGYVHGAGSVVRYFWIEPRAGRWVPVSGMVGEYQWVDGGWSLFEEPRVTPVPPLEGGGTRPGRPRILRAKRYDAPAGYVYLDVGGLGGGLTWVEYRLWPATGMMPVPGILPHDDLAEWRRASMVAGRVRLYLGGPETGGYGQWMAVHLRQARAGGPLGIIFGDASSVLELQVPAIRRRPLGE